MDESAEADRKLASEPLLIGVRSHETLTERGWERGGPAEAQSNHSSHRAATAATEQPQPQSSHRAATVSTDQPQPPDLADFLLHETAVGWTRTYFKKHPVSRVRGLDAQEARVRTSFKECAAYINADYKVADLCRDVPSRVQEIIEAKGGRLMH